MPLINTSIPNLIQGVSQQPDVTRFSGQCELQENAMSSVVDGLAKRPNTRHVARLLTSAINSNSFIHFINRSDAEQYVVIHDGTYLCAYNLSDGAEATITEGATDYKSTLPAGKYPVSGYLGATTPRTSFKALTISDSTFLVNTTENVAVGNSFSPPLADEALIYIKQGDYAKKYGFEVNTTVTGVVASLEIDIQCQGTRLSSGTKSFSDKASSNTSWALHSVSIVSGGTGFAVGDILDLPLPSPKTLPWFNVHEDDFVDEGEANFSLVLSTQPTFKVTSIGTNGVVTGLSIENAGAWKYRTSTGYGYYDYHSGDEGNTWGSGDITHLITSTGNTPVTGTTTFTYKRETTSENGTSGTGVETAADSSVILTRLAASALPTDNGLPTNSNFSSYFSLVTSQQEQNLLVLQPTSTVTSFAISSYDGLSNEGIGVVYKEVNSLDDLPVYAKNGFEVKVKGDAELDEDDYYVKFETVNGETYGNGSWIECLAPSIRLGYNTTTLPIELSNPSQNQFVIKTMKFADRECGNDDTNPLASFITQKLSNIFFFKNRVGFLSNENIIMSQSGLGKTDSTGQMVFNFNRSTVTSLLDDDPIDISVSSSRVTNLHSAVGFQENLILFSANGQFVLKGGDVLTPKTVSITPVTNFDIDANTNPIALGAYLYFPFNRVGFTGVREFSLNASTDVYDSTEITEHVPRYIPSGVNVFTGTTSEDCLVTVSENDLSTLYVYRYFYSGAKKLLSSWFKFTLDGEIRGASFIKSTLYIVLAKSSTETNLVEVPFTAGLTDSNVNHNTHLDMRFSHSLNNTDTITLPYTADTNTLKCFKTDGTALTCTNTSNTLTLTNGNVTADVWVGLPYTMKYTFSELIFKESSGQNVTPSNSSKLMLKNGTVFFSNTSAFKVKVTPKNRPTDENIFSASTVGDTVLGTLDQSDGAFRFPIFSSAEDTTITVEDDSAFNVKLSSAEFEALVKPRSKRFG